jgi:threonine aldolase
MESRFSSPARRGFASDNNSGVHPEVLGWLSQVNSGHEVAYGADRWTAAFEQKVVEVFGEGAVARLVFNGTGANVLSFHAILRPFESVICSDVAHIFEDECGAPEKITQSKLVPIPVGEDGKLTRHAILPQLKGFGDCHHSQPKIISITQSTEMGTVYSPAEVRDLAELAHAHGMLLHMDGARISNAAVALGLDLKAATRDLAVDILSLGGTKNGLLGAEAVVFFERDSHRELSKNFLFFRKQSMQLASKHRFLAAQFLAFFEKDLWRRNADHANRMAKELALAIDQVPGVKLARPVEANAVFGQLKRHQAERAKQKIYFYTWKELEPGREKDPDAPIEVRWVCSWDTQTQDIRDLVEALLAP